MNRRQFRSFVLVLLLALVSAGCSFFAPHKPSVVILSPPLGSMFRDGDTVAVQSVATDASGIARVELYVDGTMVHSDAPPSPLQSFSVTQNWQASDGTHNVSVRAANTSGTMSDPATVQVAVQGTGSPAAAPTSIAASVTPAPSPAPQVGNACNDDSAFVSDVTIPDGTILAARQSFNKVWRVRNTGTCSWSQGYQLVLVGGSVLLGPATVDIPATAPGTTADLPVTLSAPERAGTYTSMWRLRNPAGSLFGVTLTVTVRVLAGTSSTSCSGTPNIPSFTASPTAISAGQSVTLNWGFVTNADSAEIDNGIGGIATPGNATVHPTETTTYTLTAFCGSTKSSRRVTVELTPAPATAAPSVTPAPPTATLIPPTATPVPPTAAPSPSATAASMGLTRCFTPSESGEAVSGGAGRAASSSVQFGDDGQNIPHRAFLTFDIRDLIGKTIDSASLSVNAFSTLGDPFSLGPVIAETVTFSPPVKGSDFDLAGTSLVTISSGFTGQYDIKSSLASATSNRQARFQVRLRFATDTNTNNVPDMIYLVHSNDICLNITLH